MKPTPNSDYQEIATLLKKQGAPNEYYVISWNEEIDGKKLSLNEALKKVVEYGSLNNQLYSPLNSLNILVYNK
ncbi:hypothetical protein [Peribacillus frigoritolerans]|uniref:hypothetical protein n=1 Tax=Peribacillus frigoritolerans TaxID=450367 RepID=UPI0023D9AFE1|nr:hypothetical protein [Peribacillus frigoritolerans]MDF1999159.1 hypothetical protein [Peribacillus frigoritolerans]